MEPLHPIEVRVLGALLEKDSTTPEYYPLTVNALVNACNQKSNREPVVSYDEDTVMQALSLLRHKGLALKISGAGHRVEKYAHSLGEKLNLGRREAALLQLLMLRGPQTVGELRGRSERVYEFNELEEVESCLESLAAHEPEPWSVISLLRGRWADASVGRSSRTIPNRPLPRPRLPERVTTFEARVETLEREVAELKQTLESFRRQFE